MAEGGGSDYRLSATLLLNDQLSGKLRNAASQLKSINGAASRLGTSMNGEVARLAKQFGMLTTLRGQVDQFKQLKKHVAATQQAFNQTNAATAQLARQYKQGQGVVAQLKAKQDELRKTFDTSQSATAQLKNQLSGMKSEAAQFKQSGAKEEYQRLQSQIKATSDQLKASQAMTRRTGAELKSLAGGIRLAQRELTGIGRAFEESKAKASKLKQELTQQRPVLDQMRRGLAAQGFSTQNFAQSERDLRRRISSTARELNIAQRQQHLRDALAAAGMGQSKPISVNVSGNATSQLSKIKAQLQSLTGKAWNVAVNAKNAIGGKMNDLASGALLGMGAPLMGTAGAAYGAVDFVKTYRDFEYEMKTVSAIVGAYRDKSGQRLADLTGLAKKYGETTMFKASEVASAEKYMGYAGWTDESIKAGLKPLLDLAAASGEDLRRTSDIVTDAMTAFHLRPEEMYKLSSGQMVNVTEHFADVMAAMATSSNTDVNMAGEAAKYSGAIIGAMYSDQGIQDRMRAVEDWAILTGSMANAGIKASMAGTATRSIFTRLSSMQMNADAARDILGVDLVYREDDDKGHKAGQLLAPLEILDAIREKFQSGFSSAEELMNAVEYFDESGKRFTKRQRIKIGEMLQNAQKNGGKLSKKDVLSMSNMLAGQEAMSGLLSYVTSDDKDREKLIDAIRNSNGRAKEMADVKMDTLAGDLATLASAWEAFQLELMEGKGAEGFRNFTQGLTKDIRAFKKAIEDGFDIGDVGGLLARIATQLKNKFLEFDGVGSVLAGGALVMGMKKIYDWALKLKGAAGMIKNWWMGAAATATGRQGAPPASRTGTGIATSVGSMVVHAGSVVVNGRVANSAAGGTSTSTLRPTGGATTSTPRPTGTPPPTPPPAGAVSRWGSVARAGAGAGILTGVFAAFDSYFTRSTNEGRVSEAQANYDEALATYQTAQAEYKEIAEDPERAKELDQALTLSQQSYDDLRQASEALKAVQKEAIKHNNESLFGSAGAVAGAAAGAAVGSVIPGAGTVVGGVAGMVLAMLGAYLGSEIGKDASGNVEFDIIDKIFGRDKREPDWKTDEGKMFSELSFTEKAEKLANLSADEQARITTAVQDSAKNESAANELSNLPSSEVLARHSADTPETATQQPENLETKLASGAKMTPAEMEAINHQRGLAASAEAGASWTQWWQDKFNAAKEFFGSEIDEGPTNLGDKPEAPKDIQEANKLGLDFWAGVKDFFTGQSAAEKASQDQGEARQQAQQEAMAKEESTRKERLQNSADAMQEWGSFFSNFSLEDLIFSKASAAELTTSQQGEGAQADTGFFDSIFADFSLDGITEKFGTSMLEGLSSSVEGAGEFFSGIGETIRTHLESALTGASEMFTSFGTSIMESLSPLMTGATEIFAGLGEQISSGLSSAQAMAESALSSIKTSFDSALQSIQTAWGSLPSFFDGVLAGLGGAASAAGSAIYSGLTAIIGSIIGAWQSAAATISGIISSISSMASSVGSMLPSIGSVGHNATGTVSWRGGFTEINEQGGEIINLPSGSKIYPHATTMKMLQREIQNGTFNEFVSDSQAFTTNTLLQNDSSTQFSTFPQDIQLSAFPRSIEFDKWLPFETTNNSSTTTKSTTSNGVTVSGNTFHIRKDTDIDEIAFKLLELMTDSNANYAGA